MNTYGEWKYSATILDLGTRWSGQLHAPAALPQGKGPQYPLYTRLGGPQNRSGRCGQENNLLSLPGIEPRLSSPSPVAVAIELSCIFFD
jgi:hypothetical protein